MKTSLTEKDLDELSEPTRTTALQLLWLLRESGHSEELALRLALRAAREAEMDPQNGGDTAANRPAWLTTPMSS
ncbi:MAG: hypothetical protein ABI895_24760 [Deltaproteobacteria bacterium]